MNTTTIPADNVVATGASTAANNSLVKKQVANLRALAKSDLAAAQNDAWDWLLELGSRPSAQDAQSDLLALLAAGDTPDVDGRSDGVLLRWVDDNDLNDATRRFLFPIVKGYVSAFGSPWLGKKYDRANGRGTNTLSKAASLLTRVLTPGYRLHRNEDVYEGFEMYTRVEDSVLVPGNDVLVLDFEPEELGNPWPVNLIHDEVVQIVPGVYLGTKTLRVNNGYQQVAWWATKNFVES